MDQKGHCLTLNCVNVLQKLSYYQNVGSRATQETQCNSDDKQTQAHRTVYTDLFTTNHNPHSAIIDTFSASALASLRWTSRKLFGSCLIMLHGAFIRWTIRLSSSCTGSDEAVGTSPCEGCRAYSEHGHGSCRSEGPLPDSKVMPCSANLPAIFRQGQQGTHVTMWAQLDHNPVRQVISVPASAQRTAISSSPFTASEKAQLDMYTCNKQSPGSLILHLSVPRKSVCRA